MKKLLASCYKGWNQFWFDSRSDSTLSSLGLFRICFCSIMWFAYFARSFDLEFFYSEQGIMPSAFRKSVELFRYHPTILDGISNVNVLLAWNALFLLCLGMLALGLFTRVVAVAAYLLHLNFLNRNMGVLFGVDTIGTFFLLYLCFAQSGARYSLDSWLWKRRQKQGSVSHVAWRLMQLQVCVIYGYSGMEKLKGVRWWDGSALWDVMSAGNLQRWDMSFVAHFPIVLASSVYLLLLWEVYFPAIVWVPRLRLPTLAFGVLLHIGIFLFMNLPSFGFMMISLYILFLRQEEIEAGFGFLRRKLHRQT